MTTTSLNLPAADHIVLDGISWKSYKGLLCDLSERHFNLTYHNGVLEIMAPVQLHERWKKFLARLIEAKFEEFLMRMSRERQLTVLEDLRAWLRTL